MVATQVELAKEPHLMSRGVGSVNFFGFIGRSRSSILTPVWTVYYFRLTPFSSNLVLGISISTSIFNQKLRSNLTRYAPTLPEQIVPIVRDSIAAIRTLVPKDLQPAVIEAYRVSISPIYLFALAACESILTSVPIREKEMLISHPCVSYLQVSSPLPAHV